jgi:ribosomal-protein-alanine N-acetyltransferase
MIQRHSQSSQRKRRQRCRLQGPMQNPDSTSPGSSHAQTGAIPLQYWVGPVSHVWIPRLVAIDSSWNPRCWSQKLFEGELSNRAARVRGLFSHKELIGYGIAHVVADEAHIVSFGIAPRERGKGAGEYLLRDLLNSLKCERISVVTLEVRLSNTIAQSLYTKIGFQIVAVRKRYYSSNNEDALTMRLEVSGLVA